jgi:hypothetical protein
MHSEDSLGANCPFHGSAAYQLPKGVPIAHGGKPRRVAFLLLPEPRRCAAVVDSAERCLLEISGEPVDWRTCPLLLQIRVKR